MKTVGKTKIRSVRAAARPMPSKKRKAATKPKYITIVEFDRLWRVGSGRKYLYWNPEVEAQFPHPAVAWQRERPAPWHGNDLPGVVLLRTKGAIVIVAGCRRLSLDEAHEHWTKRIRNGGNEGPRARNMLALLPKLKQRARRLGWR